MRTTLDLDEAAISVARAKARAEGTSIGRAVSDLVLAAITRPRVDQVGDGGFPVMKGVPGHHVTDELVEANRDDEPADNAS